MKVLSYVLSPNQSVTEVIHGIGISVVCPTTASIYISFDTIKYPLPAEALSQFQAEFDSYILTNTGGAPTNVTTFVAQSDSDLAKLPATTLIPQALSLMSIASDDTQVATTSLTPVAMKSVRFTTFYDKVTNIQCVASAWMQANAVNATGYIAATIDSTTPPALSSMTSFTSSTETPLLLNPLGVDDTQQTIHTLYLFLATSNASYSAYTQLLEVYS